MIVWRRLLVLLGLAQPTGLDLSTRKEPYFGPSNVVRLDRERMRRMPVVFVGYVSRRNAMAGQQERP